MKGLIKVIYILASIVASCAFIGAIDLIVKIWELAEQRQRARHFRRYRHET